LESQITLIGLGNILMRDEGVGVHAVQALQQRCRVPASLEIIDGGTAGLDLLPYIEGRSRVLLVDAVNFDKEPGYIDILENEAVAALFSNKDSMHHLGLMDVLAAARLLGVAPRNVCLIGIQPQILETGLELSELLQERMEPLLARICTKLEEWGLPLFFLPGRTEPLS
jgi:hydrogenase maturation protease